LSKDYERTVEASVAVVNVAFIMLMINRIIFQ
jgi:hypothetical protein